MRETFLNLGGTWRGNKASFIFFLKRVQWYTINSRLAETLEKRTPRYSALPL